MEFEGRLRTTGDSLCSLSCSTLAKKNRRLRRNGPPNEPPKMSLSSLGGLLSWPEASCDSSRKYSLVDVAVRRKVQYADPSNWFVPLRVISDTCGPLERPISAL